MTVQRVIVQRVLQAIPVFLVTTLLVHTFFFVLPGDPIRALFGLRRPEPQVVAYLRDLFALDEPYLVQYGRFLGRLLRGDLGYTYTGRPIGPIVREAAPVTLRLLVVAIGIEAVLGTLAGMLAAARKSSWTDRSILLMTVVVAAIPVFMLAVIAQRVIGFDLGWLPYLGLRDGWLSYVLPASVLAVGSLVYVARLARAQMLDALGSSYVQTARGKGVPPGRIIGVHALRNTLLPIVTLLGAEMGNLLTATIVVEGIFQMPGLGSVLYNGLRDREGPMVIAAVMVTITAVLLANLIADVLYTLIDPRVRPR